MEDNLNLLVLPIEIHIAIFKLLGIQDLCNLSKTCKYLHRVSSQSDLWKPLGNDKWNHEEINSKLLYIQWISKHVNTFAKRIKVNVPHKHLTLQPNFSIKQGIVKLDIPDDQPILSHSSFKINLVGAPQVGISLLLERFALRNYGDNLKKEYSVHCRLKSISIDDIGFRVSIWDVGRVEANWIHHFAREFAGYLLCFDITNKNSLQHLRENCLNQLCGIDNGEFILVGTKKDKELEREVFISDIHQFLEDCKALRICGYFEISSVTGEGINDAFETLVLAIASKLGKSTSCYLKACSKYEGAAFIPSNEELYKLFPEPATEIVF